MLEWDLEPVVQAALELMVLKVETEVHLRAGRLHGGGW